MLLVTTPQTSSACTTIIGTSGIGIGRIAEDGLYICTVYLKHSRLACQPAPDFQRVHHLCFSGLSA
jgi:hypothetical protein